VNEATAIVLNYNGRGFVGDAVASLFAQDLATGLEVVVVDNASTDGSAEELEKRFGARLRVLRSPRNLGWGAGNNLGIRATQSRYVILLNNDAVAAPAFARELLAAAAAPPIGMVAAKVLEHDRRALIDTVGHLLHPDGLNRGRGRLESDTGQYDSLRTALFPSGAAGLYRRAMLEEIGLFEESFFLYADDAELGLRARLCGWQCALAPRAVAFHHYSRSVGAHSAQKAFYVERNRLWLAVALFPAGLLLANPWYTFVRLAHHAAAAFTGRGAAGRLAAQGSVFNLFGVTLRAWASALGGMGRALRTRRRVGRLRGFDRSRLRGLLREFPLSAREAAFKE
jgi:GT2 family glycosyltransferase